VAADSARVGELLSENWAHQQALDPRMCTEEMARLERSVTDAGALGGKAAGSGAGGCMFFLGPDDPGPVIEAARALGVAPEDCLMVGDTRADILAGRRAGAQTVGVLCGFGEREDLEACGADAILASTAEVGRLLGA